MNLFDSLVELTPRQWFVFLLAMLALVFLTTYAKVKRYELNTPKPATSCIDGHLHQTDGKEWHPVYIKGTTRIVPCNAYG